MAAAPACQSHDECDVGESRCLGNVAQICYRLCDHTGCNLVWTHEDCGEGVCVKPAVGQALCAAHPGTERECDATCSHDAG
jgi:hypothetical protein